jgi:Ca-activated chloride channel family protein
MSKRTPQILAALAASGGAVILSLQARPSSSATINPGSLVSPAGFCPLRHTDVQAQITGPLARVTVTQEFQNPFSEKIEAVYTFPLPPSSAVDDMTMLVGDRTIRGIIKRREEARKIYEEARHSGRIAGLLDQERPNIFTQAVANIMPGAKVKITISYVETMPYDAGIYEFRFPMVVAPRYIPGVPTGKQGGGWAPDTTTVPDASRITPNVTPEGTRAGHDISLHVALDAGVNVDQVQCTTHEVTVGRPSPSQAVVSLRDKAVIPNKDFVLKYDVAGSRLSDAVLTHKGSRGGFFTLILQPPDRVTTAEVTPKELVFVLDTSGSMSGFPIEKAKETMALALNGLNPRDTFNLITFSGDTHILFPAPVPATADNLARARQFLDSRRGSGGTEMMKAIRAALDPSDGQGHVRVVCFMTDGEVGNDFEIISEVKRHPNARVFAFGIGSSVNHFLLDNMARFGRGEVEYVGLRDDGSAAARRFHERVRNPLLTDIAIDWGGLAVKEVSPERIPDLFAARPVVVSGRFDHPGTGIIRLRGKLAGHDFSREIRVNLPAAEPRHDVLATLWARRRIDDVMAQDFAGMQQGNFSPALKEEVTQLGLTYRLMTQFTSFVAVEETIVTTGGAPRRVEVPVEMPQGMSYEGVFGNENRMSLAKHSVMYSGGVVGGVVAGAAGVPYRWNGPVNGPADTRLEGLSGRQAVVTPPPAQPKIAPVIASVIARVRGGGRPSVDEARFVFGGKAHVRLQLADASPASLEQLRKLGFELIRQEPAVLVGQVAVEKLEAVANSPLVQWIDSM